MNTYNPRVLKLSWQKQSDVKVFFKAGKWWTWLPVTWWLQSHALSSCCEPSLMRADLPRDLTPGRGKPSWDQGTQRGAGCVGREEEAPCPGGSTEHVRSDPVLELPVVQRATAHRCVHVRVYVCCSALHSHVHRQPSTMEGVKAEGLLRATDLACFWCQKCRSHFECSTASKRP